MSKYYVSNFEVGLWGVCHRTLGGEQITIAECFEVEQAERIAAALNAQQGADIPQSKPDAPDVYTRLRQLEAKQAGAAEALLREAFSLGNQRGYERTMEGYWNADIDDDFAEWVRNTPAALAAVKGVES